MERFKVSELENMCKVLGAHTTFNAEERKRSGRTRLSKAELIQRLEARRDELGASIYPDWLQRHLRGEIIYDINTSVNPASTLEELKREASMCGIRVPNWL